MPGQKANSKPCVAGTFFNTCAFTDPQQGSFGNVGLNTLRGPGSKNWDASLIKNFPIREEILAQFRVDAFNGFNHIDPGNPSSTVTTSPGTISSEPALGIYTNPRQLQFVARVSW